MADRHSMMIRADGRAQGMVTAQNPRVRAPWSTMRTRAVGIATRTSDTSQGSTVRVIHADGTEEIRPVSSFRKSRTKNYTKTAPVSKVERTRSLPMTAERAGLTNNIGADFS